jgi:thioesterase domain-containing protein/acyl carrier protein
LLPTRTMSGTGEFSCAAGNLVLSGIEVVLTEWWKELLNLQIVGPEDDFFGLGGHSLVGVELFNSIRKKYGIDLNLSLLFDARTIRQLAVHIQNQVSGVSVPGQDSILVPLQTKGWRAPLFWIPGGLGTSVLRFKGISALLGEERPVFGFVTKTSTESEDFYKIENKAALFTRELRNFQPNGPYHIIGFCGGGYIAYEMAQRLTAEGQKIGFLGIVDCVDPHFPNNWREKIRFILGKSAWHAKKIQARGLERWWAGSLVCSNIIKKKLLRVLADRRKSGLDLEESKRDATEKTLRQIAKSYFPKAYQGSCVVFIAKDTYAYSGLSREVDPRLVWCRLAKSGGEVRVVPGDQLTMFDTPNVEVFAEHLRPLLNASA